MNKRWRNGLLVLFALIFSLMAVQSQSADAKNLQKTYDCSAQTSVPQIECEALVALYYSTDGDNWTYGQTWLTGDICGWIDIACSGGHIFYIRLTAGWNMVGPLPPELGNLPYLDYLELGGEGLSGTLPSEMGNMTSLRYFKIIDTNITGNIPASFENLTNLEFLDLTNNKFEGNIPAFLGSLNKLQEIEIEGNNFTGTIPADLGNLGSLYRLHLSNNNLSGAVPPEIGNATALIWLKISDNPELSGPLPNTLTNLSKLSTFTFENTNLCEPQDEDFQTWLSGVSYLVTGTGIPCFQGCVVQTSVPQAECEALVELYHITNGDTWTDNTNWLYTDDVCSWYGIYCVGGNVESIILNTNNLVGTFDVDFSSFSNLEGIDLSNNQLSGDFSTILGNFPWDIGAVYMESNNITGTISTLIHDYAFLAGLKLGGNPMTGDLSTIFDYLPSSIVVLYLDDTLLSGTIPDSISKFPEIFDLNLSNNPNMRGVISMGITNVIISTFNFEGTNLCEPDDPAYDDWQETVYNYFPGPCNQGPPDLVIDGITFDPVDPLYGDIITTTVHVRNDGEDLDSGFMADIYIDRVMITCGDWGDDSEYLERISSGSTLDVSFSVWLEPGAHEISAYLDPHCDITETNEVNNGFGPLPIFVSGTPPVLEIIEPPYYYSGSNIGEPVTFVGSALDPEEGDLSDQIIWDSNIDGQIGVGASFTITTLSLGTHTITATITDIEGITISDDRIVTVQPNYPEVEITSPMFYEIFVVGDPITFTGSAYDVEDGDITASLVWNSSSDGLIGTGGSFTTSSLSEGYQEIFSSATDSDGYQGGDSVDFLVAPPPIISENANMVKDIYPGPQHSIPHSIVNFGDDIYFSATDDVHGYALWKSDGTEAGTVMVKDVDNPYALTVVNDTLFFMASDETYGDGLWKSDGTEAGTLFVKEVSNGMFLTAVNDLLFFSAQDDTHGTELWKSDGTEAGTAMVKDIYPGTSTSRPLYLTDVNGTLFFHAVDPVHGSELWISDGTEAGTIMVKEICEVNYSPAISRLTNVDGTVYFIADGYQLWKSDGTEVGTVLVLNLGDNVNNLLSAYNLTAFNGELFFIGSSSEYGDELWKSDGTEAGTVMVKDIQPGPDDSFARNMLVFDNSLYFFADANQLWKSDGTEAGTVFVDSIPFSGSSFSQLSHISAYDNFLYFVNIADMQRYKPNTNVYTYEHWISNGRENGNELIHKYSAFIDQDTEGVDFSNGVVGEFLLYSPNDYTHGYELWSYDLWNITAPSVSINTPSDGENFYVGSTINFDGTATDAEDGELTSSLVWNSDLDGVIGTGGTFSRSDLSVGTHTLTASVTDSDGLVGIDQVTFTIYDMNTAPSVVINAPPDGSVYFGGDMVDFIGEAYDAEDYDLTANLIWDSNLDGTIGTGGAFSVSDLSVGVHTITASVTDSVGLSGEDQISISINETPVSIEVFSGSPQTTRLNSAFDEQLKAIVKDQFGNPIVGIPITFTAPTSGASGTFADTGLEETTVVTDIDGVATAAIFSANNVAGVYVVDASTPFIAAPAQFELTNYGLFEPYFNIPTGNDAYVVGIGDFNTDGRNDIAVTTRDEDNICHLFIFLQNADGTLADPDVYPSKYHPKSIAVGDLNNDGLDDVALGFFTDEQVGVYLQNSNGTLEDYVVYDVSTNPDSVKVGDVNNDNLQDLVVSHSFAPTIGVLLQQSDGSLAAMVEYQSVNRGNDEIDVGDLNQDGLTDVVKMNGHWDSLPDILVFLQNQSGTLDPEIPYYAGEDVIAEGMAVGDITGDGRDDIVASYYPSKMAVLVQNQDGSLDDPITYDTYYYPEAVEIGDVDHDGKNDVIIVHGDYQKLSVFPQNADGTLSDYELYDLPYATHYELQGLALGDITGDGLIDALVTDYNSGLVILEHTPIPRFSESIEVYSGSFQQTSANTSFPESLKVLVKDQIGMPLPDVVITFTAPVDGASGAFADSGTHETTAITDADGIAESTLITANNIVGAFTVEASIADSALTTQFSLEITNTPPVVEILAPADRSTFDFEVPIWLNGNAADDEDGDISHLITWSSSLDGVIGTGESVVFYNASPGAHLITAEITDSAGGTAQTTIRILVFGNTPPVPILFSPEFPDGVVGTWYKFVALYGDKNGSSDFLTLQVHMDAGLGNPNGLNVLYLVDANELYLQEVDSENWIGPCTPGEVGTLSNGNVEINCKLTTPYYLGDHFMKLRILARWNQAIEAPVELDALLRATDIFDNDSGFKSKGTWTLLPE